MRFTIRGVHPIEAAEPCHLIEVEFAAPAPDLDWGDVTQPNPTEPRDNWQVAYDEQPLVVDNDNDGETDADGRDPLHALRWVFFFHYLDVNEPLHTPAGPVPVPAPTPLPAHLMHIEYEEP